MQHCNIFVYHHKNVVTLSNCYAFQLHKHMQLYQTGCGFNQYFENNTGQNDYCDTNN